MAMTIRYIWPQIFNTTMAIYTGYVWLHILCMYGYIICMGCICMATRTNTFGKIYVIYTCGHKCSIHSHVYIYIYNSGGHAHLTQITI